MADGDTLLDEDGEDILEDGGEDRVSDGDPDGCEKLCCKGYVRAIKCCTGEEVNYLYSRGEIEGLTNNVFVSDEGDCIYFRRDNPVYETIPEGWQVKTGQGPYMGCAECVTEGSTIAVSPRDLTWTLPDCIQEYTVTYPTGCTYIMHFIGDNPPTLFYNVGPSTVDNGNGTSTDTYEIGAPAYNLLGCQNGFMLVTFELLCLACDMMYPSDDSSLGLTVNFQGDYECCECNANICVMWHFTHEDGTQDFFAKWYTKGSTPGCDYVDEHGFGLGSRVDTYYGPGDECVADYYWQAELIAPYDFIATRPSPGCFDGNSWTDVDGLAGMNGYTLDAVSGAGPDPEDCDMNL